MKKIALYTGSFLFLIVAFIVAVNYYVLSFSDNNYYYNLDWLENKYVWLVFWASVLSNKEPSDILKDRLKVAFKAYESWKIEKIIVSWDNSKLNYNEPVVMQKYLINLWVDVDDIYLDYAGFDTYDSLYRAKEIFQVDDIVLFTQDFHLKRAMYIASRLEIEVYWVETNLQKYINENYNNRREVFARVKAFIEVDILNVKPTYLWEKIEIISDEKIEEVKKEILENK